MRGVIEALRSILTLPLKILKALFEALMTVLRALLELPARILQALKSLFRR